MPTSSDELPHPAASPSPPLPDRLTEPLRLQRHSPVNILLIAGSVLLTFWTELGDNQLRLLPWLISLVPANSPQPLWEVRHGEWWRLLTPAFLHFGVTHLGFNMINMVSLGNLLERRITSLRYGLLTLSVAVCSNLGQYFATDNPYFGGMSGVVYGLFGYIWVRGRSDRTFGLIIPQQFVVLALVWFVACFTPLIPHVANVAHAVGLALGAAWGFVDTRAARRQVLTASSLP